MRAPSGHALLVTAFMVLAGTWSAFLCGLHLTGRDSLLDRIEAPLADLRFVLAGPRPPPPGVVILAIDDDAVRQVGAYPLPREVVARLVRAVAGAGAKAVSLDLLFVDPGRPGSDQDLAESLRETRAVIAAAALFPPGRAATAWPRESGGMPSAERVLWPIENVRAAAGIGLANITTDQAGIPRHIPLLLDVEKMVVPSFPLRVAAAAAGSDPEIVSDRILIGGVATELDFGLQLPLRFYGPRGTIPTIGAGQVLDGGDLSPFRDRIVVVGVTATAIGDTFATPFDAVLPGVEILATAIGHLTTGDGLVRNGTTRRIDTAVTLVMPALTLAILTWCSVGIGGALLGAMVALWIGASALAFAHGLWLSISLPAAATLPIAGAYVFARLWTDQRVTRDLRAVGSVLKRFQAPVLVDRLATAPDFLAEPVRQSAAIVFVDLTGFTRVAEHAGPERTQILLSEFHRLVDRAISRRGGVVLTYMGDGAMAAFGVPDPGPEDAANAVRAARDLAGSVIDWLTSLPDDARGALGVKLGAHRGPVIVSRLGGESHQHITVTGDSVNVASRLMTVADEHAAALVCSADLLAAASLPADEMTAFEPPREVLIRGRVQPLKVCCWRQAA